MKNFITEAKTSHQKDYVTVEGRGLQNHSTNRQKSEPMWYQGNW